MGRREHFIIAGAQRSGTSFLVRLLGLHPQIELAQPLRPEPKYFLRSSPPSSAEYDQLFHSVDGRRNIRGEKSTSYLERPESAERIVSLLPEARLVFVLRDPVERALSNYRFSVDNGVETASMEEAFLREEARRLEYDGDRFSVSPFAYLARGDYERLLRPFQQHFPRRSLILLLFEDLIGDPARVLRGLLPRLGADPDFHPTPSSAPVNASTHAAELDPDLRQFLVEHFAEPNRRLAERFGLALAGWQRP